MSRHRINWKDRLGSFWARKVLPDLCFCWVHGKNLQELKWDGTRGHTRLTHLISFLKETSLQDPQTGLPAAQWLNTPTCETTSSSEGAASFLFCSIIFCLLFLPILNRRLCNSHNVLINHILKPKAVLIEEVLCGVLVGMFHW